MHCIGKGRKTCKRDWQGRQWNFKKNNVLNLAIRILLVDFPKAVFGGATSQNLKDIKANLRRGKWNSDYRLLVKKFDGEQKQKYKVYLRLMSN